ncbi:MAG: hypothetical protein JNK63_10795 [Chthonomonas sp.]|nr:hypothetical protein [Chthonomonas sp.]
MCYFLCIALAPKGSAAEVVKTMGSHEIDLCEIAENVNAHHFEAGTHFLVTKYHCDCGHPLGDGRRGHGKWPKPKADPRWSEARKARWQQEIDSHTRDDTGKDHRALARWRLALCESLVAAKAEWIGVYGAFYSGYVTNEPLKLTFHRIRQPEELTVKLMNQLPHCTVLQIGRYQAEHFVGQEGSSHQPTT